MTDPHQPPRDSDPLDPLDELASAHLDASTDTGGAGPTSDPELARRVDRLAAARDALRATAGEPVDEARREAAIAAALTAFGEADPSVHAAVRPDARPVLLVRPSRGRPRRRTLQLVGIAAAAVLLALTVPLLDRLGPDESDDTASSSFEATGGSVAPSAEAGAGSDGSAGGVAPDSAEDATTLDASSAPELGAFADLDALRTAVRDQLRPKASSTTGTPPPAMSTTYTARAPRCAPAADGEVIYTAEATVAGRPVTVLVREDGSGQHTLVVLDAACTTLSEEPL